MYLNMDLEIQLMVLAFLILLSAFFSGTEVALISVSPIKVRSLVEQKRKGSSTLQKIKNNPIV